MNPDWQDEVRQIRIYIYDFWKVWNLITCFIFLCTAYNYQRTRSRDSINRPATVNIYHATYVPHKWWRKWVEFGQTLFTVAVPAVDTTKKQYNLVKYTVYLSFSLSKEPIFPNFPSWYFIGWPEKKKTSSCYRFAFLFSQMLKLVTSISLFKKKNQQFILKAKMLIVTPCPSKIRLDLLH